DFGWVNAGLAELLYTFVLVFVVLNVAASRAASESKNEYYGLAIGFVVVAGAYGAGAVSGGCFNPAVAIGIDLASWNLGFFWSMIYVLFEIAGAALACGLFMVCRPDEFRRAGDPLTPTEPKIGTKMVSEFIGTYILVLTVGLNVLAGSQAAAFSIAAPPPPPRALPWVLRHHRSQLPAMPVSSYLAAQVAGGIAAAGTYVLIYVGRSFPLGGEENLSPHKWGQIFIAELVFTFTLCLVVLCVAASEINCVKNYFGLAIGSCVTVGGFAIGGISGGSLNPAVSFGIGTGAGLTTSFSLFQQLFRALMYSLIEILGGLLAAAVFVSTHGAMPDALLADSEKRPCRRSAGCGGEERRSGSARQREKRSQPAVINCGGSFGLGVGTQGPRGVASTASCSRRRAASFSAARLSATAWQSACPAASVPEIASRRGAAYSLVSGPIVKSTLALHSHSRFPVIADGCCPLHLRLQLAQALAAAAAPAEPGAGEAAGRPEPALRPSGPRPAPCSPAAVAEEAEPLASTDALNVLSNHLLASVAEYLPLPEVLAMRTCSREPLQWAMQRGAEETGQRRLVRRRRRACCPGDGEPRTAGYDAMMKEGSASSRDRRAGLELAIMPQKFGQGEGGFLMLRWRWMP
ncbi:unnamed protein product, partial [Prorocentrum cordatum]